MPVNPTLSDPSKYYPPIYACPFKVIYFLQVYPSKPFTRLSAAPIRATCPTRLILLNLITRKMLGEEYKSSSYPMCSFLHSPVTSSLLGPNILLNILFSSTLSLHSSLNMSDQISLPYNTTVKIIVLCILIFNFWVANWKSKDPALNSNIP